MGLRPARCYRPITLSYGLLRFGSRHVCVMLRRVKKQIGPLLVAIALGSQAFALVVRAEGPPSAPAQVELPSRGPVAPPAFLQLGASPRTDTHHVMASTALTYDGARSATAVGAGGEAALVLENASRTPRVGLAAFGGGGYRSTAEGGTESVGFGGLRLQALFQESAGFDGALAVSYTSRGFNLRPAVVSELLMARRFGRTQLLFNVGYGHGVVDNERFGSLRAAGLVAINDVLSAGLDGRFRADLELDADEPEHEPEFEAVLGPVLSANVARVVLNAHAGFSAIRYRDGAQGQGAVLIASVGTML